MEAVGEEDRRKDWMKKGEGASGVNAEEWMHG